MGSAAHVFVDDLTRPLLSGEDSRHLERVLRLRAGEEVTGADGRGGWRRFRYQGTGRLDPLAEVEQLSPPEPAVTVGFALTKGERPEWTVQKLTEAGVDRILPFVTARSIVHLDGEKETRRLARLRAVARAAAMQSRRAWLPEIGNLTRFPEAVTLAGPGAALAHPDGEPPGLDRPAVLVGPEGGFTEDELACGLPVVSLGSPILRAETAAMAVGILLCALRANVVGPAR